MFQRPLKRQKLLVGLSSVVKLLTYSGFLDFKDLVRLVTDQTTLKILRGTRVDISYKSSQINTARMKTWVHLDNVITYAHWISVTVRWQTWVHLNNVTTYTPWISVYVWSRTWAHFTTVTYILSSSNSARLKTWLLNNVVTYISWISASARWQTWHLHVVNYKR